MSNPADQDPLAPRPSSPGDGDAAPEAAPGAEGAAGESALPDPDAPIVERRARPERRGPDRRRTSVPVPDDRRKGTDRRAQADRRDQGKRAGEYDLDADTLEFIAAVNRFKEASGKPFPTWSELLGILRDLGYEKQNP